ncbi:MAG: nuclear transport factor 2 family protein [Bdellovibrionales bacterium]|nr:nuclear transport factor 2 family protein [Bdellovibrionales bacterium]
MAQEQVVRLLYEAVNSHNMQKFITMFTDDAVYTEKATGRVFRGREEIRGMMAHWMRAFPDIKINVSHIIGSGDLYCVEYSMLGKHMGPIGEAEEEVPASDQKINVPSCDVVHMKKDKIHSINSYMAMAVMMEQIRMIPSPMSVNTEEVSRQSFM